MKAQRTGSHLPQVSSTRIDGRPGQPQVMLGPQAPSPWCSKACPRPLAGSLTRALTIPTIGIGAGPDCDGQVLVFHDILGLNRDPLPRFVKVFAPLGDQAVAATRAYAAKVAAGTFPDDAHTYG